MTFDEIFTAYYTQFRADSDVPGSTEDEYTVGMRMANEAINRWENYDGMYWRELFSTNQTDGTGSLVISTGQTSYLAPTNFKEAGGFVRLLDANGVTQHRYQIVDPQEYQFKSDMSNYAYFLGSPKDDYTLNLNPAPPAAYSGQFIEYDYYKKASTFTTGTDKTEMADPYFIIHRMLANQFRASRNPYYSSAKADAENALRQMQLDNNSGTWSNPWSVPDNSGMSWGR